MDDWPLEVPLVPFGEYQWKRLCGMYQNVESGFGSVPELPLAPQFNGAAACGYELTVIVPTYNECDNAPKLIRRLRTLLAGIRWNVIFVDDNSPDGTAQTIKSVAAICPEIQCIRRVNRRGLAGAVTEGVLASAAPYVAVMDADLQHDERLLTRMLEVMRSGEADLVVASRFLNNGQADGLSPMRKKISRFANRFANKLLGTSLSDPMSGFFMVKREQFDAVSAKLSDEGFKVLLDLITASPAPLRIAELPFEFAPRGAGESKLDLKVALDFLGLIVSRRSDGLLSPRFLLFSLVGVSGMLVHLAFLKLFMVAGFVAANLAAAIAAMTSNYIINNIVTYRDRRKSGIAFLTGYARFCAVCTLGLVVNMAVATSLFNLGIDWWLAGMTGALMAGVWNYTTASRAVW